jgi:hypothetical protein
MYNDDRVWVDPPIGWQYDFPKIWDCTEEPSLKMFLLKNGYPADKIEFALEYTRMWRVDE